MSITKPTFGIETINPATGETLQRFTALTSEEVKAKITLASATFQQYRDLDYEIRSQWMSKTADLLEENQQEYGHLISLEMGKPLKSAIAEVRKCASVCRFYAENTQRFLRDQVIESDAGLSYVKYQPLGIILAVMPWNFPFWQVFRFAAPAIMAGNIGLLKHASNVPQCALKIEEIFLKAGVPEGVFQSLLIPASQLPEIIADDRIKAGTLTGSEPAGSSFASLCGKYLKKTVLELGGSDPFIVMETANLEEAVEVAVTARLLNNGQSCIAGKRFIIHESIFDRFAELLVEKYRNLKVGDPFDETTDIGPLATASIRDEITQQVQTTLEMGGKALIGGSPLVGKGYYYPPTILTDIPADSPAQTEEFFGPVALLFSVKTIEESIDLANALPLGLGSSAWTNDPDEQERFIVELEAGSVFINGMVKSDPRLPFGGIKRSGFGRELGAEGIKEFVNIKTIWIK